MWEDLDYSWPEVQAYLAVRRFVVLALSSSFTSCEIRDLETYSHDAVRALVEMRKNKQMTCKIHNLLHYHHLVQYFGPLVHFSTLHYEHHHQVSKTIARNTMNFKNLVKTISERHQYRKALFEEKQNFLNQIFKFDSEAVRVLPSVDKPDNSCILDSSRRPMKLGHSILRRIDRRQYFHVTQFLVDEQDQIWCSGEIYEEKKSLGAVRERSLVPLKKKHYWSPDTPRSTTSTAYLPLSAMYMYRVHNDYIVERDQQQYLIKMRN